MPRPGNMISSLSASIRAGLITVALGITTGASAQEIIERVKNLRYSIFDRPSTTVVRIFDDHYTLSTPEGKRLDSVPATGIGGMVVTHNFHLLQDTLNIVKKGSGPVYQARNGKIQRIDFSLDHNFQQHALEFVYHDTLFRHGGYGLWEARNFISYFSTATREWEILRPINGDEFPPGLFNHNAIVSGEEVYFHGGHTVNPYNPFQRKVNNEVWKFNFKDFRWTNLGRLNEHLSIYNQEVLDPPMASHSERLIIERKQHIFIDPAQNEVRTYAPDNNLFQLMRYGFVDHFIHDGYLYYYALPNSTVKLLYVHQFQSNLNFLRYPVKNVTRELISSEPFHTNETINWWWLLLAPLPIVLGGVLLIRKKRNGSDQQNQAVVLGNRVRYKSTDYPLEPAAAAVLELLLSSNEDVPSSKVMALTSRPGLDYPNQVRQKNQVIRSLNLELRSILHSGKDLIIQTESPEDRRIKRYRIDRSYFSNQPNQHDQ